MAITFRKKDSIVPTDLGMRGIDVYQLTGDAAATSVLITLGAESGIKTIRGCVVGWNSSHNIPIAGVAAATGFTLTFGAAPSATTFDIFIWGDGR